MSVLEGAAHYALVCVFFCFFSGSVHAADQYYFDIDPSQSVLSVTATLDFVDIGLSVPLVAQDTKGLGVPDFSDGTTGQLDGIIGAKIDFATNSLVFGGGSFYGISSGNWEPYFGGATGIAPAFISARLEEIDGSPSVAVAAIRDFWGDYADQYSVTSLLPSGANQFAFGADQWLALATNIDVQGQSGLALYLPSTRFTVAEKFATQNSAGLGSLKQSSPGAWDLTIPISANLYTPAANLDGIGEIDVTLHMQGQIVAHSVTIPADAAVMQVAAGHNSVISATAIDGAFNLHFNPNVGDTVVGTSVAAPHAAIHGLTLGGAEYLKFTVTAPYTIGIFDIDGASFDSLLSIFNQAGQLIASNDDNASPYGALGSHTSNDAYLEYTFTQPGVYYVAVGMYSAPPTLAPGDYLLNVTLSTAAVPEASTGVLAGIGLIGLLLIGIRRRLPCRFALITSLFVAALINLSAGAGSSQAAPLAIKNSLEGVYDSDGTYPMPYRLFSPAGAAANTGHLYPLVLFLHGAGERGTDNFEQVATHIDGLIDATQSTQYASFLLAPQMTDFPYAGGWDAFSPFDRTIELIEQIVQTYPVDPARIYITGLSMGGYGTFDYLAEYPHLFAAAVPMSGGGSPSTAPLFKDVPLWAFHGDQDDTVNVSNTRNMITALTNAGGHPLYTEIAGGGHDIWGPIYNDAATGQYGLYDWMFAQTNPNATLAVSIPEPSTLCLGLLAAGALMTMTIRRRRSRRFALLASLCAAAIVSLDAGVGSARASSVAIKTSLEGVYDSDGTYPMPYRLFSPAGAADNTGHLYPLVLFLHGSGQRGTDNFEQVANHIDGLINATQSAQYASFLLAPQLTDYPYVGGWDTTSPFDRTIELLEQIVQIYPVDPSRIYITGLSMGAFGTFDYLADYPNLFAAAVPISGGGSPGSAPLFKDVPLWAFHGDQDTTVNVSNTRNMITALNNAGGHPLYTEIPGGSHEIGIQIYNDAATSQYGLYDWMFAQTNPNATLAVSIPEPSTFCLGLFAAGVLTIVTKRQKG